MKNLLAFTLALFVPIQGLGPFRSPAEEIPERCDQGQQASGALWLVCMPEHRRWNGDLVIYAHGYVAFNEPVQLPDLELPDGPLLPDVVNALGFAFATTSYSVNGLAVLQGIDDVVDLVAIFEATQGAADRVYLVGASEGGLITTLATEQFPDVFAGGLAACGPIGDFNRQIGYWGDFRVAFDYFFPSALPGSPVDIPEQVIQDWETVYEPAIAEAIEQDPQATDQLLQVTGAPIARNDAESIEETVLGLLWYNVFATNDGRAKLGGQPFGNRFRIYRGSDNDLRLNRRIERFRADPAALERIQADYQTSGVLESPLVSVHTTRDPIVPFWHARLYRSKVADHGSSGMYANLPIPRYGHCEFMTFEVLAAFGWLIRKATGNELTGVELVLPDPADFEAYLDLSRQLAP